MQGYAALGRSICFPQDSTSCPGEMQDLMREKAIDAGAAAGLTAEGGFDKLAAAVETFKWLLERDLNATLMVHFVGSHRLATTCGGKLTSGPLRAGRRKIMNAFRVLIKQPSLYANLLVPPHMDTEGDEALTRAVEEEMPAASQSAAAGDARGEPDEAGKRELEERE